MEGRAFEVVWVAGLVCDHLSGVLVDGISLVEEADVWQREKRWDVGIIHENP